MSVGWGTPWTQHWSNWSHKARNASIGRSLRYFSSWILSVTKNKMPRQKINAWLTAHMTGDSWPSVNLVHWCGTLSHLNIKPWKEAWICVSPTLCSRARTQLALEVVEEASLHDHDRRPLQTSARSQGRSDSESCDFWSFSILGEWDDLCPISGHIVLQDSASITQLDKRFVALVRDWRCCFASHCRLFRCENERRKRMHPSTSRQANKFCEGASRHPHIQVEYIPNLSYCLVKQCRVLHVLDMLSRHLKTSSFFTFHCSKTLLNTPQPSSLLSTRQKSHVLQDLGRFCEIYQVFSS